METAACLQCGERSFGQHRCLVQFRDALVPTCPFDRARQEGNGRGSRQYVLHPSFSVICWLHCLPTTAVRAVSSALGVCTALQHPGKRARQGYRPVADPRSGQKRATRTKSPVEEGWPGPGVPVQDRQELEQLLTAVRQML
jgi:hypothetical protein